MVKRHGSFMHRGLLGSVAGPLCATGPTVAAAQAQATGEPTGFLLGLGPDVSVNSYGGQPDYILDGQSDWEGVP